MILPYIKYADWKTVYYIDLDLNKYDYFKKYLSNFQLAKFIKY